MHTLLHSIGIAATLTLAGAGLAQKPGPATPMPAQKEIDAAIDNGAKFLLENYAPRLAAGRLEAQERVGQSALSLYTMLKAGVPRDDPTVRRLLAHVLDQEIDQTYDATCALLALSAHDATSNRRWIEELAHKLVGWQLEGGDWSYPSGLNDLSNTQYAALGLWVAASGGVPIDAGVWTRLADAVLGYQCTDGGFGYGPATGSRTGGTGSMTAAGVATLAMCEVELRIGGRCTEELASKLAAARGRGMEWLTRNFSITTNPKSGAWLYYYLYGLERLGAVSGVARLGGHDWYDEGAAFLVPAQGAKGAWQNGTDLSDTCFAVLFLKRATSARRGPVTGEASASTESDAALKLSSDGSGPVRVWIERWNRKLAREIEWPDERGRGPRVVRVEYRVDDRLVSVQLGDGARAADRERFPATLLFDSPGKHRLQARAYVLAPEGEPRGERALDSQELEVDVAASLPAWIGELGLDLGPNLGSDPKLKVKASSRVKAKEAPMGLEYPAESILDGRGATPWLADSKDDQRTLTISFNKSVECNVIRISSAVLPAFGQGYLSRPIEVELVLNGKNTHRLPMDPDPLRPMRVELDHKTAIRRLDLRILSVATSEACPLVGIGEVELFLRKR